MGLLNTLNFVLNHPLNRDQRFSALGRFVRWQLGSRLLPGPAVVDFVDQSKLLLKPGVAGATGNVYAGLHEFWEMAFTLHVLREGDLFVDVGANVGVYTVLASAAAKARSISFEPVPSTCDWLRANARLNDIGDRVDVHQAAVGEHTGVVRMTDTPLGPMNRVVSGEEKGTSVPVKSLDEVLREECPVLIKVDVEGFEAGVVTGAHKTLAEDDLLAVIIEIGNSEPYNGHDPSTVIDTFRGAGFEPFEYDPLSRQLYAHEWRRPNRGNVLFVKEEEEEEVSARISTAKQFRTNTGALV